MDFYIILYAILGLLGVYVIINAVSMKKGKLAKWLKKGITVTEDSDIPGFAKQMFGMTIYMGIVLILFGIYGVIASLVADGVYRNPFVIIVFLIFGAAYMVALSSAKRKYLDQTK